MSLLSDRNDILQRNPFILLANRFRYLIQQRKMDKIVPGKLKQIQLQELDLNLYVARAIVDHLKTHQDISKEIANKLVIYYMQMQSHYQNVDSLNHEMQKEDLSFIAIEAQRSLINDWYREGVITNDVAKELKRFLISLESVILLEQEE